MKPDAKHCFMERILHSTLRALATLACTFAPAPVSRVANGLPRKAAPGVPQTKPHMAGCQQSLPPKHHTKPDAKHHPPDSQQIIARSNAL